MKKSWRNSVKRFGIGHTTLVVLLSTAAILLLLGPQFLSLYWLRILSNIFMFATLAQAINIITGYTGYPAFGNVVFFGLGGYTTAIVMVRYGGSFALGLLSAVIVCIGFAVVFGRPLLRLRGHYFAIATLGLNEATRAIINNLTDLTGGGMGLSLPLPPGVVSFNSAFFYYLLFGVMVLSILVTYLISVSRMGYACRAIRDNEIKAESMGIHTTRHKMLAWSISAALTGLVGGINAYWLSYIEPSAVFDMTIAVKSFVMYLIGGAGTVLGPIFGAFFIELVGTFAWSNLLKYHLGILGAIIVMVVVLMPDGFVEFVRDRVSGKALLRTRKQPTDEE
jgi:branched-chain amino acid transport system permease protein